MKKSKDEDVSISTMKEKLFGMEDISLHRVTLSGGVVSALQLHWGNRLITLWSDGQVNVVGSGGETGLFIK